MFPTIKGWYPKKPRSAGNGFPSKGTKKPRSAGNGFHQRVQRSPDPLGMFPTKGTKKIHKISPNPLGRLLATTGTQRKSKLGTNIESNPGGSATQLETQPL
ncbi:hypothetical protein ISN44_As12g023240 [Arabidopsis suecica]|uniref:Uncharacterized protein n=1 Tax=Arabidopsis suecica TaxID=45249 RepID=A0A8T1YLC8_ARASU|nr:hypothetical protein ISN44_As12g023240 [Arabidopsis suecica]